MKITFEPTGQIVTINNSLSGRIWKGKTDRGYEVDAIILCIACQSDSLENARLAQELCEIQSPFIT